MKVWSAPDSVKRAQFVKPASGVQATCAALAGAAPVMAETNETNTVVLMTRAATAVEAITGRERCHRFLRAACNAK